MSGGGGWVFPNGNFFFIFFIVPTICRMAFFPPAFILQPFRCKVHKRISITGEKNIRIKFFWFLIFFFFSILHAENWFYTGALLYDDIIRFFVFSINPLHPPFHPSRSTTYVIGIIFPHFCFLLFRFGFFGGLGGGAVGWRTPALFLTFVRRLGYCRCKVCRLREISGVKNFDWKVTRTCDGIRWMHCDLWIFFGIIHKISL